MPLIFAPGRDPLQGVMRDNPPRTPEEYRAVISEIERWVDKDNKLITENAKMNKPVQGERWLVRGFAMLAGRSLAILARDNPGAWGLTEAERRKLLNIDLCPGATAGCEAVCLVDAGQMGLKTSRQAQINRTLSWVFHKESVRLSIVVAVAKLWAKAKKERRRLGFRLNVTSDLPWEAFPIEVPEWLAAYMRGYGLRWVKAGKYANIMEIFYGPGDRPQVMFYDYTKIKGRMENMRRGVNWPRNYWLTWSLSETPESRQTALWVLKNQISTVAVPFNRASGRKGVGKEPLPADLTFTDSGQPVASFPVVDADTHDLRFKDPPMSVSGLRFKIPKKAALKGKKNKEKAAFAHGFIVSAPDQHPTVSLQGAEHDGARYNPPRSWRTPALEKAAAAAMSGKKARAQRYLAVANKIRPLTRLEMISIWRKLPPHMR